LYQRGTHLTGADFIASSDNKPWGHIPVCLAIYPDTGETRAGPIVVSRGSPAEGFMHVYEKHRHKIAHFHPGLSVDAYLRNVLRHFQRVYLQSDGSLWLFRTNGTTRCAVVAPDIIDRIFVYRLITAYPIQREPNFTRRRAIRLIPG